MLEGKQEVSTPTEEKQEKGRWIRALTDWKEALPIVIAVFGLLYGIGWALQYQAACRLGVGALGVSREAAMATVVALIGLTLPSVVLGTWSEWAYKNLKGTRAHRWSGILLMGLFGYSFTAFMVCGIPLVMGDGSSELKIRILAFLVFAYVVMFVFFLLRVAIKMQVATVVLGLVNLAVLTQSFSGSVLGKLPEALGGPGTSKVAIQLKEPSQVITATIVMSDDKFFILKDVEVSGTKSHFPGRTPILRLPFVRVVDVIPVVSNP